MLVAPVSTCSSRPVESLVLSLGVPCEWRPRTPRVDFNELYVTAAPIDDDHVGDESLTADVVLVWRVVEPFHAVDVHLVDGRFVIVLFGLRDSSAIVSSTHTKTFY